MLNNNIDDDNRTATAVTFPPLFTRARRPSMLDDFMCVCINTRRLCVQFYLFFYYFTFKRCFDRFFFLLNVCGPPGHDDDFQKNRSPINGISADERARATQCEIDVRVGFARSCLYHYYYYIITCVAGPANRGDYFFEVHNTDYLRTLLALPPPHKKKKNTIATNS